MEVIGDGDHEQSFLVPRFERAKRGREGDFPLLHSILIMPFCFIPMPSATHPHIQNLAGYTPKHHHLSPSSPQVLEGHWFDLAKRI